MVRLESLRMADARKGLALPRAWPEDAVADRRVLSRSGVRKRFPRPGHRAIARPLRPGCGRASSLRQGGQALGMRTQGHAARCIEISSPVSMRECWDVPQLRDRDRPGKWGCSLRDDLHVARRNRGDIVRGGAENSSRLPLADNGWPGGRYALAAEQEKHR